MKQIEHEQHKRERVYALLDRLEIKYDVIEHTPIFTQEDSELRPVNTDAIIFKNLFLRNKDKSHYYLYSLPLTKRADLAAIAKALGESRLSFGDEHALQEKLNIRHGSVSFLNVIGSEGTDVSFLIDSSAFFCEKIGIHPNDNSATVILKPHDIERILSACGAEYRFLSLENRKPVITTAQREDAEEILRVQYTAYQSEAVIYNDFSIQPLMQTLEQAVAEYKDSLVLKAVLDGKVIGSVRAYEKEGTAYIGKLMVLPGYQDMGLGKRLLQSIENEFKGKRFELYTGAKSGKNLAFYEKNGYVRFKTVEAAPGLTLIYLEKPLFSAD